MSDQFLGEIRMFGGNFAPNGWAFCDGQLLAISQNTALFSLLGTTYGGNGVNNFALPDLRNRVPLHVGQGPGLSPYHFGQSGGAATVVLTGAELPAHVHSVQASSAPATTTSPAGAVFAAAADNVYAPTTPTTTLGGGGATTPAGGSQPHDNQMPSLCLNFIIALTGIYPSRA